jgi:predicted nucleic acid-binding protein
MRILSQQRPVCGKTGAIFDPALFLTYVSLIPSDWRESWMTSILIDTDVLIDHLRGFRPASDFLRRVFKGEYSGQISVLTETELLAGAQPTDSEKQLVESLLGRFSSIPVSSSISRRAGHLLRMYRPKGLSPVDAIIASTCLELRAVLVTRNVRNFSIVEGLLTLHPYPETQ